MAEVVLESFKDEPTYSFPAIRGIQAQREYYIAMLPLKTIPQLVLFDEDGIPPELRAQRVLNKARVPEIASYIINNAKEYVFSSLTASIDSQVHFIPFGKSGSESKMGVLVIPMTARILINDGQHRRAAIEEALKHRPDIGLETISVVFFIDSGLKKSQQMFADLNQHAVKPTKSLSILYDHRDPFSRFIKNNIIESVPIFKGLTELEKTTISNRSRKLFTLSSIYTATRILLRKQKAKDTITEDDERIAIEYWTEVTKYMPQWQALIQQKVHSSELREDFVNVHGIALHALGIVGQALVNEYPRNWKNKLKILSRVDWSRKNKKMWEGRAMLAGKLSKSHNNGILTSNILKKLLKLKLTPQEIEVEKNFKK